MAGLTLKDLRAPNKGRIQILISKLQQGNKSPFTTVRGDTIGLTKIAFTERGRVEEYKNMNDPSQVQQVIQRLHSISKSNFVVLYNDADRVQLSDILKTQEFGGRSNKGDMAEIIFSAALAYRFMKKNTTVSETDVWKLINMIDDSRTKQDFYFKSDNKNPLIKDQVHWQINSSLINIRTITNPRTQNTLGDIVQSSVKYANSSSVQKVSKTIYENNTFNKIDVLAIGAIRQTETKVDVLVKVDGKPVDINISLKAAQVKQFGQVGGSSFEKQRNLWESLFPIDVDKYEQKFYDILKKKGVVASIDFLHRRVTLDVNQSIMSNKVRAYDYMSNGIRKFATNNDKSVLMVQLTKKEAVVYQFNNLSSILGMTNTKLKAVYAGKTMPQVNIVDEKNRILFSVRCKREGNYIRHYIEKGKMLSDLVGLVAA